MARLPIGEFDGQRFIDASRVEWIFDESIQCWLRKGQIDAIPVADGMVTGLLPANLKFLLDRVPEKGGGFAITTRPHLQFRSEDNPDGVIFGDIDLISDTLDIRCVHSDGREIGDKCLRVSFKETDEQPPGFDINFSDKLLENLCVVVPGGPGKPGEKGPTGEDGKDGTGDGPIGLRGEAGKDATEKHTLIGIRLVDLPDITDVAVTKMELDGDGGKLFVTKGKVQVPDNEEATANRLIVSQINRGLRFLGDCMEFELTLLPCRPDDDYDTLDPTICALPSHFNPKTLDGRKFQPVKRKLSDLIYEIVAYYQSRIDAIADQYDKEIEAFIVGKDKEARQILDQLGDRLAECENITYLDYCIGLGDRCIEPDNATTVVDLPADNPECQTIAEAVGGTGSSCQVISSLAVRGDFTPVFSFDAPDFFQLGQGSGIGASPPPGGGGGQEYEQYCPDGCWVRNGPATAYIPPNGRVVPGWTPIPPPNNLHGKQPRVESRPVSGTPGGGGPSQASSPDDKAVDDLTARLKAGITLYKKQQFMYSALSNEFPAGTYAFVYQGGAFSQDRLSRAQSNAGNTDDLIQGAFQDYWVGNEGDGKPNGPLYVLNPTNRTRRSPFTKDISTTEIGLEIGWAPKEAFSNLLDADFFDKHAYNPSYEVGNNAVDLPNPRVDYVGVSKEVIADENTIQWQKFPKAPEQANRRDAASLENAYLNGFVENRIVTWKTTGPGLFFARVKLAYSGYNYFGTVIMPPVKDLPQRPASLSKATLQLQTPRQTASGTSVTAFNHAVPIAKGEVRIQVVKVNPPAPQVPAAINTTPGPAAINTTPVPGEEPA